jgi:hypothetical protein
LIAQVGDQRLRRDPEHENQHGQDHEPGKPDSRSLDQFHA